MYVTHKVFSVLLLKQIDTVGCFEVAEEFVCTTEQTKFCTSLGSTRTAKVRLVNVREAMNLSLVYPHLINISFAISYYSTQRHGGKSIKLIVCENKIFYYTYAKVRLVGVKTCRMFRMCLNFLKFKKYVI